MTFLGEYAHTILENPYIRGIVAPLGINGGSLPPPSLYVERVFEKVESGETLDHGDALVFDGCSPSDLFHLLVASAWVRQRAKGARVTFSKNVFVPLTRLCRDNCGYCTFKIEPGEGELFVPPDEVVDIARRGSLLGCTELLFVTGDKPELKYELYRRALGGMGYRTTAEYACAMSEACFRVGIFPHSNLGVCTRDELAALRRTNPSMGLMLETVSTRLLRPGEAHHRSPDKVPALRLRTMRHAGELRIPWTTGILVGIGETWEERVSSLVAIRELDEEYGHIQEIIVQNFAPKPGIRMEKRYPPTVLDMLRTLVAARLMFPDKMNIQVPPNLTAREFPLYILAGANDLGGVSPITIDYVNPEAPWPQVERMKAVASGLGLSLRERLPVYPEYIREDFLDARVYVEALKFVDDEGLVPEEAPYERQLRSRECLGARGSA
jgi:7,8-didemethyl-8-hydroxy-5-deazariboflavin synthase CofG subunit